MVLTMNRINSRWLQLITHFAAWLPLAIMVWDYFQNQLTFNPIQEITFRTGKTALVLLVLSLAVTPVNTLFGWRQIIPLRKLLGLYAFMYAGFHFLIFVGLDYGFNWQLIQEAIFEKRYALVGFAAFVILTPLAITSTKGWMRRLGRRWKHLHRLVYGAGVLVVVHYVWLVKSDVREPLVYGAIVGLLLLLRVPIIRRWGSRLRVKLTRKRRPPKLSQEGRHLTASL